MVAKKEKRISLKEVSDSASLLISRFGVRGLAWVLIEASLDSFVVKHAAGGTLLDQTNPWQGH